MFRLVDETKQIVIVLFLHRELIITNQNQLTVFIITQQNLSYYIFTTDL